MRFEDLVNAYLAPTIGYLIRGYSQQAYQWTETAIKHLGERASNSGLTGENYLAWFDIFRMASLGMQGKIGESQEYLERFEKHLTASRYHHALHLGWLMQFYLEQGEFGPPALEVLKREKDSLGSLPAMTVHHSRNFYIFEGYFHSAAYRQASKKDQPLHLERLRQSLKKMRLILLVPIYRRHHLVIRAIERAFFGI